MNLTLYAESRRVLAQLHEPQTDQGLGLASNLTEALLIDIESLLDGDNTGDLEPEIDWDSFFERLSRPPLETHYALA